MILEYVLPILSEMLLGNHALPNSKQWHISGFTEIKGEGYYTVYNIKKSPDLKLGRKGRRHREMSINSSTC